jgi:outer membrane protein assembly factor BamB
VGIFCFDFEGKEVWRHELAAMPMRFGWGTAASPALHGGRLYYCSDNEQQSSLLALDVETGKQLWRTEREDKSNWSTPFVWQLGLSSPRLDPAAAVELGANGWPVV